METYKDITEIYEKRRRFSIFKYIKLGLLFLVSLSVVFWEKTGLKKLNERFKVWFKSVKIKLNKLVLHLFNDKIFLIVIRTLSFLLWISTTTMLLLDTITVSLPIYIESLTTDTVLVKTLIWAVFDLIAVTTVFLVIWAIFRKESRHSLPTVAIVQIFLILAGLLLGLPDSEESVYVGFALLFSVLTMVFSQLSFVKIENQIRSYKRFKKSSRVFFRNWMGVTGLVILFVLVTLAALGPGITQYESNFRDVGNTFSPPSSDHFLGTDQFGYDVWTILLDSLGISLLVGVVAGSLTVIIGTTIGVTSAYVGGWFDTIMMRFADIVLVLPPLPLMFLLASLPFLLGSLHWSMIAIIYVVVFWPVSARLIRGQALSLKQRTFIHSAKASGAGNRYIIFSHLLPNVFPLMLTMIITSMRQAILYEAFLAYLGLGDPLNWSLGLMLQAAENQYALAAGFWWLIIPPAIAIALTTLSFAFIGMAFDEIVNPRLRKR